MPSIHQTKPFNHRERQMLAGLYLSKFSRQGLDHLGFKSFTEAYNAIGYALDGKPSSIKNYMQEFDPLFPNGRKGWHGREVREWGRFSHFNIDATPTPQNSPLTTHPQAVQMTA